MVVKFIVIVIIVIVYVVEQILLLNLEQMMFNLHSSSRINSS